MEHLGSTDTQLFDEGLVAGTNLIHELCVVLVSTDIFNRVHALKYGAYADVAKFFLQPNWAFSSTEALISLRSSCLTF